MGIDKIQIAIINLITVGRTNGLYSFEKRISEKGVTVLIMLIVIIIHQIIIINLFRI